MNPTIKQYLASIGRRGGKAGTPAQNKARARNAKRGGWPKGRPRKPQVKPKFSSEHLESS